MAIFDDIAARAAGETAADQVNPRSDFTGKNVGSDLSAQPLLVSEQANLLRVPAVDIPTSARSTSITKSTETASSLRSQQLDDNKKIAIGKNYQEQPEKTITITPNRLHEYATYTYGLTLHLLTPDAFNEMSDNPKQLSWLSKAKTIISSAGRYGTDASRFTFQRAAQFADDFYFDGLTIQTIIGLNAQTRGSNFYELNFSLIEPYGLTLINRLLDLSAENGVQNYLVNPYVLQIDFFAYTDDGDNLSPLPDLTKYIPIKFTTMKIKVDNKGATYNVTAIPYNHIAFLQTVASTPADFEVTAQNLKDFFVSDSDSVEEIKSQANKKQQDREELSRIQSSSAYFDPRASQLEKNVKSGYQVKSYTGAYNAYQQFLVDRKIVESANILRFVLDKDIKNSEIVNPIKNPFSASALAGSDPESINKAVQGGNTKSRQQAEGVNTNYQKFTVNAGTSINEVINMIMRNSKYITDQLTNKNELDKEGKPLNWFKVVPKIKIQGFDRKRNDFSYDCTFIIQKYSYHNSKHPLAPQSTIEEVTKGLRKEYNYIYTGKNNDIIDFNIDFDHLFFTAVNVFTENTTALNNSQKNIDDLQENDKVNTFTPIPEGSVTPQVWVPVAGNKSTQIGFNVNTNSESQKASDVMQSVYSSARGDMLNVQLKIIGDPDFIKQDDVFYNPGNAEFVDETRNYDDSGSILTDRGDIFCLLSWKTPTDIDESTGGVRYLDNSQIKDAKFIDSSFSGVFKVNRVTSEFRQGKFEQTLMLIRYNDVVVNNSISNPSVAERQSDQAVNANGKPALNNRDIVQPNQNSMSYNAPSTSFRGVADFSSSSYSTVARSRTPVAEFSESLNQEKLRIISSSGDVQNVDTLRQINNGSPTSNFDDTVVSPAGGGFGSVGTPG